ncbi:FmdB family zinc ribbon protein [Candidatus Poribacteria bacterium]
MDMPIYEYKCNECGGVQEVLHTGMRDVESVKCTDCGSGDLTRLISAFNVSMGGTSNKGLTCCGKEERCSMPPCNAGEACRRD